MDVENNPTENERDPTHSDNDPKEIEHDPTDTDHDPTGSENEPTDYDRYDGGHGPKDSEVVPIEGNDTNVNQMGVGSKGRKKKNGQIKATTGRPVRMKTLSACLNVFGLFKNPSKLYQEPAMKQIYLTLLTQKDGEIQKLAIACLMAYKFDYLLPYKENLDRLMEDKTFRDELMSFSCDEDLNVVIAEHRTEFIHILIR